MSEEKVVMKGCKAFNKGMKCRDKQYAEHTVFEEDSAESGMHFCKNPLDTLEHYPLVNDKGEITEFAEVEALDEVKTDDYKLYCTKKLKIGAKISLAGFIKASLYVTRESIIKEAEEKGGDNAKLAGGDGAKLAGGDWATLAGGDNATLAGGYGAKLAGGDWATLAGGYGATLAGGYGATLAGGDNAIIAGGHGSIAKGKKGAVILLVERNQKGEIINFNAVQVDGEIIKEDTFYKLENGEFVEVEK